MKLWSLLPVLLIGAAAPLSAQTPAPAPAPAEGIEVTVSDESEWQDLGIAIPAFATNAERPTQTMTAPGRSPRR